MMVAEKRHEVLYQAYLTELRTRWPKLRIIPKDRSVVCRLIQRLLWLLTFGGQSTFMDTYTTTLGQRIYVPRDWEQRTAGERYCVLRHEAIHVAQFSTWTWPGMCVLYLLVPIPIGFAAGRAFLEWQGYRETLTATWQIYGPEAACDPSLVDMIVKRFSGPDYGWMWLRGTTIRKVIRGHLDALREQPPTMFENQD
jgi:hypothetical protein